MYLDHRQSTDFHFVTPLPIVDPGFARSLGWLKDGRLSGGPGMVDARLPGQGRQLLITLMETGALVPAPVRDPVLAPNGVAVAHPFDLVIAKSLACLSRNAERDYVDLASATGAWPSLSREAVTSIGKQPIGRVAACIGDPPPSAAEALGRAGTAALRDFAAAVLETAGPADGRGMDEPT